MFSQMRIINILFMWKRQFTKFSKLPKSQVMGCEVGFGVSALVLFYGYNNTIYVSTVYQKVL